MPTTFTACAWLPICTRCGEILRAHSNCGRKRRRSPTRINQMLYVDGKGYWRCRQPDGSFNEVRHCYDFLAVLDNMSEDLSPSQKQQMDEFFWRELHSEKWMRALSQSDADATWNIRPDHSCLGAYAAWPAMTAKGLYKVDRSKQIRALADRAGEGREPGADRSGTFRRRGICAGERWSAESVGGSAVHRGLVLYRCRCLYRAGDRFDLRRGADDDERNSRELRGSRISIRLRGSKGCATREGFIRSQRTGRKSRKSD